MLYRDHVSRKLRMALGVKHTARGWRRVSGLEQKQKKQVQSLTW
jgi:hypothetical protein